jgi:hypothetical protein
VSTVAGLRKGAAVVADWYIPLGHGWRLAHSTAPVKG